MKLDTTAGRVEIVIDFVRAARFAVPGEDGMHGAYDTQTREYRHVNFYQHQCYLAVHVPRVGLPEGRMQTIVPA